MANVKISLVRSFTLFPKHVTFTPRYGQSVLENILIKIHFQAFTRVVYQISTLQSFYFAYCISNEQDQFVKKIDGADSVP